jgi:hypothetical protein
MEADVPAELEGLVRGIADVELSLFIKVSIPFSISELGLPNIIK